MRSRTHLTRRPLIALSAAILVIAAAALGLLGVAAPASASVQVPPGCGQPSVSSTGHSMSMRCTSGHGGRYKVTASACDSHHCVSIGSNIVRYGTTATLSSGGWFSSSSAQVYWYPTTGGSACAYSRAGGTVHWCDMQQSILNWVNRSPHLVYEHTPQHGYYGGTTTYRLDCAGLVSMAWHLTSTRDTDQLTSSSYTTVIARKDLRPGDILDDTAGPWSNHHAVVFERWNSDHHAGTTDGTFRVWSFGTSTLADDGDHHVLNARFVSGYQLRKHPVMEYTPRRYVHGAP